MTKRVFLACILTMLSGLPAQSSHSIVGGWEGTLESGTTRLTLIFHITQQKGAGLQGTLEVPEQNGMATLRAVIQRGDSVVFELGFGRYKGMLSEEGKSIQGAWEQNGLVTAITLRMLMAPSDSALEQDTSKITAWVREHAIPLKTVEPGRGFEDMAPLKQVVGEARIVAVGEATHGTREFFRLKHRLFEFLVEQMGFTVFAIEANLPEARPVNEYVLNGAGYSKESLAGLYFWTWKTEEVLDLIEWMRSYNANPAHTRKVKFYGFDMQVANLALENVLDYLWRVDPKYATRAEDLLSGVPLTETERRRLAESETKQKVAEQVRELLQHIDALPHDEVDWRDARQDALVIQQAVRMMIAGGPGIAARDEAMAANVAWILDQEGPDAKIMLWAHNGHVRAGTAGDTTYMGGHLRKRFGNALVSIGFAFNQGSFQAIGSNKELREFTVKPAPPGSLDAVFAGTKIPVFAVDLRAAKTQPVTGWFKNPQKSREIGATFSEDMESRLQEQAPSEAFDVIMFVEKTSRARALPQQ